MDKYLGSQNDLNDVSK